MRCEEPLGHVEIVKSLWRAARGGRLAHALCFTGPAGVGKFLAAEWFAAGLLCQRGPAAPCGVCGACKRLKAQSHADVFVLDPEALGEETIAVGQIAPRPDEPRANIGEFLALAAFEGGFRVVLVRSAERMHASAQNALLKTLEEPGRGVVIVLETARPDLLLSTVHSRCLRVSFVAPERAATRALLVARGVSDAEAGELVRWTGGAPGAALALRERGGAALRDVISRTLAGEVDVFAAATALGEVEGTYHARTPTGAARLRARTFVDLCLAVLADGVRALAGADPGTLAHGDLAHSFERYGERALRRRLEQCLVARQDIDLNLAPDAVLERALLALAPSPEAIPR